MHKIAATPPALAICYNRSGSWMEKIVQTAQTCDQDPDKHWNNVHTDQLF